MATKKAAAPLTRFQRQVLQVCREEYQRRFGEAWNPRLFPTRAQLEAERQRMKQARQLLRAALRPLLRQQERFDDFVARAPRIQRLGLLASHSAQLVDDASRGLKTFIAGWEEQLETLGAQLEDRRANLSLLVPLLMERQFPVRHRGKQKPTPSIRWGRVATSPVRTREIAIVSILTGCYPVPADGDLENVIEKARRSVLQTIRREKSR